MSPANPPLGTPPIRFERKNPHSYIHTLPSELMANIFLHTIVPNNAQPSVQDWTDSNALARLGVLNLVCTLWRDISLAYKVLWSIVSIQLTPRWPFFPPQFLATVLERSGGASLSVHIVVGAKRGSELQAYSTLLQSHMHRVVEFKINLKSRADIHYAFPLQHPMPRLARFCAMITTEGRQSYEPGHPLHYYLPPMSHSGTEDDDTTHPSRPMGLDSLHVALDTETLAFLPQHAMGIHELCLISTDDDPFGRGYNRSSSPVSIHGTYSLHLADTAILGYNFHFPDVTELVINSRRPSWAVANLEGVFPAVRSLSLGPFSRHDTCFIHTCAELIKQTRETVTELRFHGEYGVAETLERAFAKRNDRADPGMPIALRHIVVERLRNCGRRKDIRLYTETRQDMCKALRQLLELFPDVAIIWNHGLKQAVDHSTFASDMKAIRLEFPGRLVWSAYSS